MIKNRFVGTLIGIKKAVNMHMNNICYQLMARRTALAGIHNTFK
jgi:hypothetical protein